MLKRASVKLSLFSVLGIALFLISCGPQGGGDAYKSEVKDTSGAYGGIEVSSDRRKIRIYGCLPKCGGGGLDCFTGEWVNINSGGVSQIIRGCWWGGYYYENTYTLEINNGEFRIYFIQKKDGQVQYEYYGGWAPICPNGGGASVVNGQYKVETRQSGGKDEIRFCYKPAVNKSWVCGNWVEYVCGPSCPQGYTYNPSRNVCEADPQYTYTCPLGNYSCIEETPGTAYCSPYNCSQTVDGQPYCLSGPISSEINANVVGLWWCSGDQTWLRSEQECIKNCPYYTCSLDGQEYTGLDVCQNACRRQHQCEVY